MSIQATAVKIGSKNAVKLLKRMAEPFRRWYTKRARKRQGKEFIQPYVIALLILSTASGCATVQKAADNLAIAVDDKVYNSSTAIVVLPDGYDINPYVTDAADQRQTIDGWKIKYEIIPKANHVAPMLKDKLYQGNKGNQSSLLSDVIKAAVQEEMASQKPQDSGVADAAALLQSEAAKDGIK